MANMANESTYRFRRKKVPLKWCKESLSSTFRFVWEHRRAKIAKAGPPGSQPTDVRRELQKRTRTLEIFPTNSLQNYRGTVFRSRLAGKSSWAGVIRRRSVNPFQQSHHVVTEEMSICVSRIKEIQLRNFIHSLSCLRSKWTWTDLAGDRSC